MVDQAGEWVGAEMAAVQAGIPGARREVHESSTRQVVLEEEVVVVEIFRLVRESPWLQVALEEAVFMEMFRLLVSVSPRHQLVLQQVVPRVRQHFRLTRAGGMKPAPLPKPPSMQTMSMCSSLLCALCANLVATKVQ